jgi:GNAT superfamily N-acetyltransferase/catechol 2,3-dioxygenase-like lactoylglutathione lyase family enzyme
MAIGAGPDDHFQSPERGSLAGIRVETYTGPRADLRALFRLAEDSTDQLDSYIALGRVLVAVSGGDVIGHLQLVDTDDPEQVEIKNMAVRETDQGQGVGRRLIQAAADLLATQAVSTLLVGTAAADIGNLRFYQRQGFRLRSVERDAFTPDAGYPPGTRIDGIELRDRLWLDRPVRAVPTHRHPRLSPKWTMTRIARPAHDLARSTRFYRDLLGLSVLDGFTGHDGYDGVFFALPGGGQLELTIGPAEPVPGTDEDLLVLYVSTLDEVATIGARLTSAGVRQIPSANPYWNRWGRTFLDPDGYRLVIATASQ